MTALVRTCLSRLCAAPFSVAILVILNLAALPAPAQAQHAPLDLLWSQTDLNGAPTNPQWWWQLQHPGTVPDVMQLCNGIPNSSTCTTQKTTLDLAIGTNKFICSLDLGNQIPGHVNWFPVMLTNAIFWSDFASDYDYNFNSSPADQAALTFANYGSLGEEFDSRETIDGFRSPWWQTLRQAVESRNVFFIDTVLTGHNAGRPPQTIMLGLFGLDCPHDCKSELHPLFVMAIELDSNPADNMWAIFVRNWGDEGFCSHRQHLVDFPGNEVKLLLPYPGASRVRVLRPESRFFANNRVSRWPDVDLARNAGAVVSFRLPPPEAHGFMEGELHLKWTTPEIPPLVSFAPTATGPATEGETGEPETYLQQLLARQPEQLRRMLEKAAMQPAPGVVYARELLPPPRFQVGNRNSLPPAAPPLRVREVDDLWKTQHDRQLLDLICPLPACSLSPQ